MNRLISLGILLFVLIGFSGISFAAAPHTTTRDMIGGDPMNPESVGGSGCNTHTLRYWNLVRYSSNHVQLRYKETDLIFKGNKWRTSLSMVFVGDYHQTGYHKMKVKYSGYLNGKYYTSTKTRTTSRSAYYQCKAENPYDSFGYIS